MDINKCLLKSIENKMEYKELSIELSENFNSKFFDVAEEVEKDNIRTYIKGDYGDSDMFLYVIAGMLKNNELTITFNKNATEKNMNYLEKLSKEF